MIKISNVKTNGWDAALRGMRNSRESWDQSDTVIENGKIKIGPNDLKLASRLASLGGSDAKFRRMIMVTMDIKAPMYWWKEFDTYKVGTVANSTSTMYGATKKEFTIDDFSTEHLRELGDYDSPVAINVNGEEVYFSPKYFIGTMMCQMLNFYRDLYLETDDPILKKEYWWQIIQMLPSSYNQLRTVSLNYEVLSRMCRERMFHKLDEWKEFCWIMLDNLPYARELIDCDKKLE